MDERRIERRKYPRIKDKGISVKLSGGGVDTITQSLDVSASGIYCKIAKRIPLMTIVQLALSLPGKTKRSKPILMNIEGVVVREHAVREKGHILHYDVAIFFHTLMPTERRQLAEYIERRAKLIARR